jgi:hypothetical protein
MATEKN